MKRFTLLFSLLFLAIPFSANSTMPAPGGYNCQSEDFRNNIKTAKYIVVARLEKHLEGGQFGEYKVLVDLKGHLPPDTIIIQSAPPYTPNEWNSLSGNGIPVGTDLIYVGDSFKPVPNSEYRMVIPYKCYGKSKVTDAKGKLTSNFLQILNYFLEQEQ